MRVRPLALLLVLALSPTLHAAVFTVTNNANSGAGSLDQAILDANDNPGPDIIEFAAGVSTIPGSTPPVTDPVVIDGRTAPLYVPGGPPVIHISGGGIGFIVNAPNVELHALQVTKFFLTAIAWTGSHGAIKGCYIGIDGAEWVSGNWTGIQLSDGATGNTIGGADASDRNVIASMHIVAIEVSGAPGNTIAGNYIGTDATGSVAIGSRHGIFIRDSPGTIVSGNLIADTGDALLAMDSPDATIIGNTIGLNVDGIEMRNSAGISLSGNATGTRIGGTAASDRNVVSGNGVGIRLGNVSGVVIQGNSIGTSLDGLTSRPNGSGIRVSGSNNTIGGPARGEGNLISGNTVGISLDAGDDVLITGNLIGTNAHGTAALPNNTGVSLSGAGGPLRRARVEHNVIAGNTSSGIAIDRASDAVVTGNFIGTDGTGTIPLGNGRGIIVSPEATNISIGGALPGEANTILYNADSGIGIGGSTTTAILANAIDGNGGVGIDYGDDGVTPNDPGDADGVQNHPIVTLATSTLISGTLHSAPATPFRIELFASPAADATGFGEGRTFLGFTDVTTDAAGSAAFTLLPPAYPPDARYVSSTATRLDAGLQPIGTSEFSAALPITPDISIAGVTEPEGNGGATAFMFAVTLSRPSVLDAAVSYLAADSTATAADGDYVPATGTLVIPAGATLGTITVTVAGDTKFELEESFLVALSNPVNGTITVPEAIGVIVNDDAQPTISVADVTRPESGVFTFTLTLSHSSEPLVSVTVQTADGSATAPDDYAAAGPAVVSFAPGTTTQTVTIAVLDDALDEADETFVINLVDPVNATIAGAQATGTIVDDDDPPSVSIADISGSESSGSLTFTLTLSSASGLPVSVTAQTADCSALAGSDYTAAGPAVLSFAPSVTSQTYTVAVLDDALDETDETFVINLTDPINATIAGAQAEGTIVDDDGAPSILISDVSGTESSGSLTFTLTLSNESALLVSVTAQTADGTATAGSDYTATGPALLSFDPGVTSQTFTVPLLDDAIAENTEAFIVTLSDPVNASVATPQSTGTIEDDDAAPTLSIDVAPATDGGTVIFVFTLSGPAAFPVTVDFATADETAIAGTHYTASAGTLTFAPGITTQTITIPLLAPTSGGERTFVLTLSNASGATLAEAEARATISGLAIVPAVPTLSPWMILLLLTTLAFTGILVMRRT